MHQTFQRICSLAVCGGCLGLAAASAAARQQAVELWPTATEMPADNGWDYEDEALGPPDCPDCTVGTSGCVAKEEASFPTHDYMKLRAFRTSGGGQYSLPAGHRITSVVLRPVARFTDVAGRLELSVRAGNDPTRTLAVSRTCGTQESEDITSVTNWDQEEVRTFAVWLKREAGGAGRGDLLVDAMRMRVVSECHFEVTGSMTVSASEPCEGTRVVFTAPSVTYAGQLATVWYRAGNPNPIGFESTLVLDAVSASSTGGYYCTLTNGCGSANFNASPVSIRVVPTTRVDPLPSRLERCAGVAAELCANASGENLSYQWFRVGNPNVVGTSRCLNVTSSAAGESSYFCVVNGRCGTSTTNVSVVAVYENTLIRGVSGGGSFCVGTQHQVCVDAVGEGLSYAWFRDGTPTPGNASCIVVGSTTPGTSNFTCVVSGRCGSQTSAPIQVNFLPGTEITGVTGEGTRCEGQPVQLCVNARGSNLRYQWYFNGAPTGGNSSCLSPSSVPSSSGIYTCEVTGDCGTLTSQGINVQIRPLTRIDSQSSCSETIPSGIDFNMFVQASGAGVLRYQWFFNGNPLSDGGRVSGSNTAILRLSPARYSDRGTFRCEVTGDCGPVARSCAIAVDVICPDPAAIVRQPVGGRIGAGVPFALEVEASGSPALSYQWLRSGLPMSDIGNRVTGTRTSRLDFSQVCLLDDGFYSCRVCNDCGDCIETRTVRLTTVCRADFNDDAFVDFFDYSDFVTCFEGDNCPPGQTADFNGDGFLDFFDYNDFVAEFEQGCCR